MDDPAVVRELSRLDPAIPFRASSDHLHHTWARTFYSRPELYIQPQSIAEIQKLVTVARRCRRRLVTVGSGHSPSDLTCTSSWLVNLDNFNRVLDIDRETYLVTVEAGIRLRDLGRRLEEHGMTLSNLGSIDSQSIAGVIATGTHGSSLWHGLISECIISLTLMLANGQLVRCSASSNPDLFRAALISLGALGIVVEVTLQAEPTFKVAWKQSRRRLSSVLAEWSSGLWTSHEFVRVWWMPYEKSAIVWHADKTNLPLRKPPSNFYGEWIGYQIYHNLLALSNYFPRILPWVEWFVFGMQYGFKAEATVTEAVEPARKGLLMNCLYSQFVNEWALPLEKGPEAITRLSAWLHGDMEVARIPFPVDGLWVHCPVEVRVADSTHNKRPRPFLDPTCPDGPTLYLNATLYRPYHQDPPCKDRYYEAFEWLMRDMGGKPHWAKNFHTDRHELHKLYGKDMDDWLRVRREVDTDGMFLGEWHHRNLPLSDDEKEETASIIFPLSEREKTRHQAHFRGAGDGLEWIGDKRWQATSGHQAVALSSLEGKDLEGVSGPSPPMTAASDESFDMLATGEASVILPGDRLSKEDA
ncbi:D-arabinono-1,4-lactone oxidase [Aspergillus clavatus NRRL 1]|uniref:D-arabinono-1,4-lactone oxidase n=1 Tax=Aspergillus clavatus (strain ATCC 1007 / CBS 513.65 / DSM 816 / NCTC 3887 / NRRL 1 / QM 1276 / 107) TaxID=344612 RepID=A1CNW2_ASPCL|nr:sugar 1,4-lactone oxidase, putative [Aspergillus clavatus NRRL 1]EAW07333.1 sugar 1,4-lactone oxidase, putative [Aspergillus clavatus NRRL 1]